MPLRELLQTVLDGFPEARLEPLTKHPLASFIRHDAAEIVREALGEFGPGLLVEGSAGAGNWAAIPWISIFDPAITTSATRGYYVVYLFSAGAPAVYLSLNQGTTAVRAEFGSRTREILRDRADLMRKRVPEFASALPAHAIDLGSESRLPGDYAAGHALGVMYARAILPNETQLCSDLQSMVRAYRALTFRGGTDSDIDSQADLHDEFSLPLSTSIVEIRRYSYHRKVERNRTAARHAKNFHGTRCQACELDLRERYGAIGAGFIEAHHLRPIASLEEGVAVKYDVPADFSVLCPNCHRMIHRYSDPSDLEGFRKSILRQQPSPEI